MRSPSAEVALPKGADLLVALGLVADAFSADPTLIPQADSAVTSASLMVKAYTRGQGFSPSMVTCEEAVAAVILSAAARAYSNFAQSKRIEVGNYNEVPGSLASLSLLETQVLGNYRRTSA